MEARFQGEGVVPGEYFLVSTKLDTLQLRRYKAKYVKTRCLQEWVGHLVLKFQVEGVVPGEYFLVSTKLDTRHTLSDIANCTVLRAVVLTQYRRVTDRQTDERTDGQSYDLQDRASITASRSKNHFFYLA